MNKGLKSYTKQIKRTVDGAGEVYVNINKNDANAHVVIPLLSSVGQSPINTSLIFNYQERNEMDMFGDGVKMNLYGKVSSDVGKNMVLKNADGSRDLFEYSSTGRYNKETKRSMDVYSLSGYYADEEYVIKDNDGNVVKYKNPTVRYPRSIEMKNGEQYTMDFVASQPYILNGKGDKLVFTKANGRLVSKVEWQKDSVAMMSVELEYESDRLTKLTYKKGDTILAETVLSYSDEKIVLCNAKTGQCVRCDLSSGMVVSVKDGHSSDLGATITGGSAVSIAYESDEKTSVTDDNGNKSYVYFDKEGMPIFETDTFGRVVKTVYDKETKAVLAQSAPIETNTTNNVVNANNFECEENLSKTASTCTDGFFKPIVGENTVKFVATGNEDAVKTASCVYSMSGIATDSVTAIIWAKQLTAKAEKCAVYAELQVGGDRHVGVFDKETVDGNYDVMVLGVNTKKTYSDAELRLYFEGNCAIEIGKIQILKKEIGAIYKYSPTGNLEEMTQGGNQTVVSYDENNKPKEAIGADGTEYNYEYDESGNVKRAWGAYSVRVDNEYDTAIKSNLTKQTISNVTEDKKIVTSKQYDSATNAVSKEIDELGNATSYEYNRLGNVKKITDAMGVVTEFNYQNDTILQDMLLKNGTVTEMSAHYQYDSANRINKVTLANGAEYGFEYDTVGNISKILLNGVATYVYSYDGKGRLVSQAYGNGDKYVFGYDGELLKTVSFVKGGTATSVVKYTYEYDALKRVSKIFAGDGTLLNAYTYDDNDRVVKQSGTDFAIEKTYDNLGNVATQINTVDGYGVYQSAEPMRHSKLCNSINLFRSFTGPSYVGEFSRNAKLAYYDKLLSPITHDDKTQESVVLKKENRTHFISVDEQHLLSYKPESASGYAAECGHVDFWFRQNTAKDAVLFSCNPPLNNGQIDDKSYIEALLSQDGHISIKVTNFKGETNTILTSTDAIANEQWNFFALDFYHRDDGEGYTPECRYRLTVNGKTQVFRNTKDRSNWVDLTGGPTYNIGHGYYGSLRSNVFCGDIACLRIYPRDYTLAGKEQEFYEFSKKYIDGTLVPEPIEIKDISATNVFALNKSEFSAYDVYPLQKNVYSLTGKKPLTFDMQTFGRSNSYKETMFEYDQETGRYAFVADGASLSFPYGNRDNGTVIVRAKANYYRSVNQIFEIKDFRNKIIGLYRGNDDKLFLNYEGTKVDTGLVFKVNKWHTVGISFNEETVVSDIGEIYSTTAVVGPILNYKHYLNLRIFLDGQVYSTKYRHTDMAQSRTIMIGRTFDDSSTKKESFGGLMETLALSNKYITEDEFASMADKLNCMTRENVFDEFGMYQGSEIRKSGTCVLSNKLTYKSLDNTENGRTYKQLSKVVAAETITAGGTTLADRAYTTDKLGRVTGITDSKFGNHSYTYDSRGFLVKDGSTAYEYDANGNITKIGNTVLEYDSVVKDKLVKVGGKIVAYDANNPLVPTSYDGNTYTFEGRRLAKIQKDGKVHDFEYNEQGLRIKKTVTESGTSVATRYFYDGDKLVAEISPAHRLDFLYDENDKLYGFILDKSTTYFYVRDALENILGIIDNVGNLVVQYAYNAWGKPESTTGTLATTVGELNPFRYKGYYFDKETGMYYCNSRFYVPEFCRFLSADTTSCLNVDDLYQMNLFAYCSNDPILFIDTIGTKKERAKWKTIFGAVAIAGLLLVAVVAIGLSGGALLAPVLAGAAIGAGTNLVSQGINNLKNDKGFFEDIDWLKVALAGATGAAFSSGAGGLIGSVLIGSVSNAAMAACDDADGYEIAISAVTGGVAAFAGFKLGKFISRKMLNINTNLTFKDYVNMARVDGANFAVSSVTALMSKLYTMGPQIATGVTRTLIKMIGKFF